MNSSKTFIIAEAGVNHNGELGLAFKLIDEAVSAKVDAVKFQTWITELLLTKEAELADYQKENGDKFKSQFDMAKKLELSFSEFYRLKKYCDSKNIIFLSTADEIESANYLYDLQDIFKIGSGEITNLPYLRHVGSFKKKVILSTGMATIKEIRNAVDILVNFGTDREFITVLHCTSEYPAPMDDINLKAMFEISNELNVRVGYSDHSLGIEVPIAAVALGAKVIEKHFTLDRNMSGPDHKVSLEPDELKTMVRSIRNIEKAMGDGVKRPFPSEEKNIPNSRKSIIAKSTIRKGEIFSESNLGVKRPGNGISPMNWDEVLGKSAIRTFKPDELIELQ